MVEPMASDFGQLTRKDDPCLTAQRRRDGAIAMAQRHG
jgi:hypothetical protein